MENAYSKINKKAIFNLENIKFLLLTLPPPKKKTEIKRIFNKILVTGGAGFIGSHLVKNLLKLSNELLVIDDLSSGKTDFLPLSNNNLKFIKCDLINQAKLKSILERFKPNIIIHLAAIHYIPYCNENPVKTCEVNIGGTRNLLECCRLINPSQLFFASSAAVYPIRDGPNKEDSEINPVDIYGFTKIIGEDLTRLFHRETGIKTVIGRLFNVYGPNDQIPHIIPEIINQLKFRKRKIHLGNIEPKRDFIHVDDVVNAIIALINSKIEFDVVNIGTGKEYSVKQALQYLEDALGESIKVIQNKNRIRKTERIHLLADISKIQSLINWKPELHLKDGLAELLKS